MAQRFAAAVRGLFGPRQQEQAPHAAPPDDLSIPSRYDTDGSSYEYEEIIPDPPQSASLPAEPDPPAQPEASAPPQQNPSPATPAAKTRVDQKGTSKTPVLLRRLGVDVNALPAANADDASSHYSLRPRRRRRPGAPEPRGVETSRVAPDAGIAHPLGLAENPHSISLRPSRAALEDKEHVAEKPPSEKPKRGPRLPAPSAATTSAIAARPDFVAVGNLDEASTATLQALCKKVGVPASGSKKELKERALAKLGERQFLNEDTMMVDSEGNPRAVGNTRPTSLPGQRANSTPQKEEGDGKDGARVDTQGKTNGEHQTTTTVNRTQGRNPRAQPTAAILNERDSNAREQGNEGVTAKGGVGVVVTKSECAGASKPASQLPVNLHLEIPLRDSSVGVAASSNRFPTLSSTGIGAPRDMPPSPAFGNHPGSSPYSLGRGLSAHGKMAEAGGDPTESVDARGGENQGVRGVGNQSVDMESVFGDLARGRRRLSPTEYEACLKALNENYHVGSSKRNVDVAALLSARGVPGASAMLPRNSGAPSQLGSRVGSQPADATMSGPRGSFSAAVAIGASSAMRPPQIPPVPPNTPGITSSSALPLNSGSLSGWGKSNVPVSSTVLGAAAVLRLSHTNAEADESIEKERRPDGVQAENATAGRDIENDIASERNHQKDRPGALSREGIPRRLGSEVLKMQSERETKFQNETVLDLDTAQEQNGLNRGLQNPLRGKFIGAIGGPNAHNTVGFGRMQGRKDDPMEDIVPVEPRAEHDMPLAGVQPSAPGSRAQNLESCLDDGFATPRDVIRSFNSHGVDGDGSGSGNMDGSGSQSNPAHPSTEGLKDIFRVGGANPRPAGSFVPGYWRGLSSVGKLNATRARRQIPTESPVQSGRVTRPRSLIEKRALSSSSGELPVNPRKRSGAPRNHHIAEKLRKQDYLSKRSKNPPLAPKSLRILEELVKVREENRSHSTNKRGKSPIPVPPSIRKRARLTGEFTKVAEKSQAPNIQQSLEIHGRTGDEPNPKSQDVAIQSRKRKSVVYGSGRKRSRTTSPLRDGLSQMKSFADKKKDAINGTRGANEVVSPPKLAFGESFNNLDASGRNPGDGGKDSAKQPLPSPLSFCAPSETAPDPSRKACRREKRSRAELGSDKVPEVTKFAVESRQPTSAGAAQLFSGAAQQNQDRIPEKSSPFNFGRGQSRVEVDSLQQGQDGFVRQTDGPRANSEASPSTLREKLPAPRVGFGTTKTFNFDEPDSVAGVHPTNTDVEKSNCDSVAQSLTDKRVPSAPFNLSASNEKTRPGASVESSAIHAGVNEEKPSETDWGANEVNRLDISLLPAAKKHNDAEGNKQPVVTDTETSPRNPPVFAFGNISSENRAPDAGVLKLSSTPQSGVSNPPSFTAIAAATPATETKSAPAVYNFGGVGDASFGAENPTGTKEGKREQAAKAEDTGKPASGGQSLFGSTSVIPPSSVFAAPPNKGLFGAKLNSAEEEHHGEGRKSTPEGEAESAPTLSSTPITTTAAAREAMSGIPLSEQKNKSSVQPTSVQGKVAGSESEEIKPTIFGEPKLIPTSSVVLTANAAPKEKHVNSSLAASTMFPSKAMTMGKTQPSGGGLGSSAIGNPSATDVTPFVFGASAEKDKSGTSMPASLNVPIDSSTSFSTAKNISTADHATADLDPGDDAMKASTTPPTGQFTLFGGSNTDGGRQETVGAGKVSGPLFGQPSSSPGFGAFGGANGSAALPGGQSSRGFTFGNPKQHVGKDPSGPFGAPQFTPFSSTPKASTFVFGTSSSQAATATAAPGGSTTLTGGFGSGFQNPSGAFGSTAAFSGAPQFGSSQSAPVSTGAPFGSAVVAPGGTGNLFGSSQPALSRSVSPFGSAQPGLSGPPQGRQPSFGTGIGAPSVFGAFGSSGSVQPGNVAFGGPFTLPNPQPPAGSGAQSAPFSFGASTSSAKPEGDAFNIGAAPSAQQQIVRRPRKTLRGRRTLR